MSGARSVVTELPRSTAYYYADLEKMRRDHEVQDKQPEFQVYERTKDTEVVKITLEGNWSPEYSTPENGNKVGETYSTAGTFPLKEIKEKEPLLAELELVGRVPLTQLDNTGVRRTRSWYLCCPNVGDEEISRESSWRYSSLRPVTAAPVAGRNGVQAVASHSSGREDIESLRAERDALVRALAAERQRAAAEGRAHDARLAELHGVIAELVRRRTSDRRAKVIPEEELSDECESITQPAGDVDNDVTEHTEQYESSSGVSPAELNTPQELKKDEEVTDRASSPAEAPPAGDSELSSSMMLAEEEVCLKNARCCQHVRADTGSCDRERGSPGLLPPSPSKCEFREAKMASRVRLKKTQEVQDTRGSDPDEAWCVDAAERLALDVCAQADLREALVATGNDEVHELDTALAHVRLWRARCGRLAADCRVLDCALARAVDTAHRLSCACAVQESSMVCLCGALRAADRALEVYDVLLALAETQHAPHDLQRQSAEAVARRVLWRLESAPPAWGEPLLPPGPWAERPGTEPPPPPWTDDCEIRLRTLAAQLKRETVQMRALRTPPALYSPHDSTAPESVCMSEMEAAVLVQEVLASREQRAADELARRQD
ncbi:uncharacterized protein LOC116778314 isoform X1 [Danaus plexippus]|uniref:uncharacterized protein LOC116778314 isoform X1 n=1 Tax=Danaus plexippus TaxID=13037 RepID=UPI002AB23ED0|nr:uncharacterized protein LOC116778314 isoform X1 [Danaus plexippus]XP_061381776.1 uncharacterized protein LOC116778314 isoform X1 [Danaus plexippus]XP_061381777.1 uncharacterized protein LOC116778314 isoform X1 [Danaus plexippus]XP_061381778.1 uncharacterized protein LOC116778314 isoform X1 [Danaus plexippus]